MLPNPCACERGVRARRLSVLRPNLTKAVLHTSISIYLDERLTDERWEQVAQAYLDGMGFADCQYVVTKHTDTEHPHIYILANRISMSGGVVGEVEYAMRTDESSARMRLQELADNAIKGEPNLNDFAARQAAYGVEIRLNEAKTGRVSGVSFALDGVSR